MSPLRFALSLTILCAAIPAQAANQLRLPVGGLVVRPVPPELPAPQQVLSASRNSLAFGSVALGGSATEALTLSNTGTESLSLTLPLQIQGGQGFSASSDCPATLAPATSCNVVVTFEPQITGPASAELSVLSSAPSSPQRVTLDAAGVEPPRNYAKWNVTIDGSAAENVGAFSVSADQYSVYTTVPNNGRKVPMSQSTTCKSSGKWYWEITQNAHPGSYSGASIASSNTSQLALGGLVHYYWGRITGGTNGTQNGLASTVGLGGTYGVALDADARTVRFFWNGVAQGVPVALPAAPAYCPAMSGQLYLSPAGTLGMTLNSGYAPMQYTAPAGFTTGIF